MAPSPEELSDKENVNDDLGPPINAPSSPPGDTDKNKSGSKDKGELSNLEQSGGLGGTAGGGIGDTGWKSKVGLGNLTPNQRIFIWKNRKTVLGGGIVATIMGLVLLFSVFSGPLQFITFGKLLEQFHMTSTSNTQNDRFLKAVRWVRYAGQGEVEKTRLSFLGNKVANYYETKLNAAGLKSAYTDTWGLKDGYEILNDTRGSPFDGLKTESEVKAKVAELYGQDYANRVKLGSQIKGSSLEVKGKFVVDVTDLGYLGSQKFNFSLLKSINLNGLMSTIGTRVFVKRDAAGFGPISDIKAKLKRGNETQRQVDQIDNQQRVAEITKGESAVFPNTDAGTNTKDSKGNPTPETQASQDRSSKTNSEILGPIGQAAQSQVNGNSNAFADVGAKVFKSGAGLTGAIGIGALCIAQDIDSHGSEIKQAQVREPLIRQGIRMLSIMSEIQAGKPVDPKVLTAEAQYLTSDNTVIGKDSSGNAITTKTTWYDAASIQAELKHPNKGVPADSTLQNLGDNSTPFGFTNDQPLKATLNGVCNPIGGIVLAGLSILGGNVAEPLIAFGTSQLVNPYIEQAFISWTAGQAANPNVAGADLGNHANYGMKLAANDQNASLGGTVLSSGTAAELDNANLAFYQNQFNSQSLFHKLLSPTDPRSAIAGVVNHSTSSVAGNFASLVSSLFKIGHIFSFIGRLFAHPALAASSAGYDYGVPTVGFSASELSDPQFDNPYANADKAAAALESSQGQDYINKAKTCFNVQLAQEDGTQWGVQTLDSPTDITADSYKSANCADTSDPNWSAIRFFILDTETMNSMACYASDGSDPSTEQACTDIGFSQASQSTGGGSSNSGGSNQSGSCAGSNQKYSAIVGAGATYAGTDQGIDFVPSDGSGFDICAPASGTITLADQTGHHYDRTSGQALVIEKLDKTPGVPSSSQYVYFAEIIQINSNIKVGSHVNKGDLIGHNAQSPGIETGWGTDATHGFVCPFDSSNPGAPTPCGTSFNNWILAGGGPDDGSLPGGSAQKLAQQLVPYINNGTVKCVGSDHSCSDIVNTAKGISIKTSNCVVNALDSRLVGMLLKLVQMGHNFGLSAICSDHPYVGGNTGHSGGKAADFNFIDGTFMGPNPDEAWTQAKINAGSKLDKDIVSFMKPGTVGFGQVGANPDGVVCHPNFSFLSGYDTFGDTCHHQHIQIDG